MKKRFTFLMAAVMLLGMMVLPGKAVGQNYTYVVASSIEAGDVVVLVNAAVDKELSGISTTNTKYGLGANVTNSLPAGLYPLTVVNGSSNGTYAFKNNSNKYLYWGSSNSLNVNNTLNDNTSWTVSIANNNEATIANGNTTSRIIRWNSDRFACYTTNTGTLVKIYKRVESKVATPTFSPAAGSYSSTQSVTISSTTGATIYYTTDGTDPRNSSTTSTYSSAITVSESMTIQAYATKNGLTDSDVATAEYNIVPSQKLYITSAHGTVAVTANDASVSITDGYYSIPQGASVTLSVTPSSGYTHTGWTVTEGSVTITNNAFAMPSSTVRLTANYEEVVEDKITHTEVNAAINSTSNGYQNWSGVTINTAVYAGCSYNNDHNDLAYIQLRNQTPAGIVTTTSGGYAKKVSVTFVNNTQSGRTITVYGKNTAYSGPSDLYSSDADVRGTSLGTIVCGTNTEIAISGDYQYIGLLANGALYVEPITINWLPLTFYDVYYTASYTNSSSVEIGTVEVSKETAVAGETITITATGKNHYHFNGWTVLDDNAEDVPLTGTNPATFTMPASDVDVEAAWEEDTKYTISVADGSEDYVLAPSNSYAAETILVQITDVPSGKFIDEVTVAKNGGGNVDDVTYTGQEGDYYNYTFTMPAEAVTVSVTFKDPATYTVSYYVNGTLDKSEVYIEGASVTLPTSTTTVDITGFTLLGWSETEGGTTTLPAGSYYPLGNTPLYAVLGVVSNTSLTITPNTENLPTSYGSFTECTLEGKIFKVQQVYVPSGNKKIQWRSADHSSGAGIMYNNENFGRITSIVIAYYTGDDAGTGQNRNFSVKAGTSANPTSGTLISGTTTGDVVTFDLSGSNYTYFVLAKGSGAGYLSSITINYEESASVSTVTEYTANNASRSTDIEASECVIVKSTGVLTFTGSNKGNVANIIIEDGGQLIHTSAVNATLQKEVSAYSNATGAGNTDGWYFIASPLDGFATSNLALSTADLYSFDEEAGMWWNAKNEETGSHPFTALSINQGYLYANSAVQTLEFAGNMQATNNEITIKLNKKAADGRAGQGVNLVGNPFTRSLNFGEVTIGGSDLTSYYIVEGGTEIEPVTFNASTPIKPGRGFMVEASADQEALVLNPSAKGRATVEPAYISIEAGNESFMDRAYVQIGEGNTLRKMTINNNVSHVYVQQAEGNYAAATIEAAEGVIPVAFDAAADGTYTITVNVKGLETEYLHLIDNMTGADVDLLVNPSYTFNARNNDYESRFKLVFSSSNTDEAEAQSDFAFISNGNLIVAGTGTLQIVDMMGRTIASYNTSDLISTSDLAQGVYVLRLVNGDNVKTQKIVVK